MTNEDIAEIEERWRHCYVVANGFADGVAAENDVPALLAHAKELRKALQPFADSGHDRETRQWARKLLGME